MIRPVKMKQVKITVLDKDIDSVLKYLGRRAVIQFSHPEAAHPGASRKATNSPEEQKISEIKEAEKSLEKIKEAAAFLEVEIGGETGAQIEPELPGDEEARSLLIISDAAGALEQEVYNIGLERQTLEERLKDAVKHEGLPSELPGLLRAPEGGAPFLNVRIGSIDGGKRTALETSLQGRAIIVPLNTNGGADADGSGMETVLAVSSKTGRFAMDSSLKDAGFVPLLKQAPIVEQAPVEPQDPAAGSQNPATNTHVKAITERLGEIAGELGALEEERRKMSRRYGDALRQLAASFTMALAVLNLKSRLLQTRNTFELSGWVEAPLVPSLVKELDEKTGGRVSVRSYDSWEVPAVREGREKVPVKLRHGKFVKSFEPIVLSYGAPLYGAIDPTPFTAVLFSLLFGVMFGDVGQGAVLLLLGIAAGKARIFATKRHFSGPLIIAGICAMFTGLLYGSVFSNEELLEAPTRMFTEFLQNTAAGRTLGIKETGHLLRLMPETGAVDKLFYFFGFTLAIGVIINSLGIALNIANSAAMRRWEHAFFSKHGLAGGLFFWYAIFIAIRAIVQKSEFRFLTVDAVCLALAVFFIVTGPVFVRLLRREKLFEEGIFAFVMEGIVEILETCSGYISNTVSFLRVGAFALSHAVLSFIIFTMAEKVADVPLGAAWSLVIIIFGNALIIVLEGMIVAIQVIRLQYYEFFSKFFTETGSEFAPFHFKRR
ncbi:MAG: V-type ATP synthase subunit I [Spirochaetaceae bacterium]|jgi:V/A-type H+-transporting ATPase subunit I|nr:V-type ATP synthase subunit I [Spirochaetaceae bacterium]